MSAIIRRISKPSEINYIMLLYNSSRRVHHIPLVAEFKFNENQTRSLVENYNYRNSLNFNFFKRYFSKIINCWNCQKGTKLRNSFFCENCGSLQDVQNGINYFQLFSLNERFDIDSNQLTTRFRQLQSFVHPDKFSNKNEKEQEFSLEWSSLINKAYKTLLTPLNRGEYMLKLKGISLPQDNSALDKEFLIEVMERNEEIEEANKDNIHDIKNKIEKDLEETMHDLEKSFNKNDYENVISILIKMKYLKSIENSIKEKISKLCNQ